MSKIFHYLKYQMSASEIFFSGYFLFGFLAFFITTLMVIYNESRFPNKKILIRIFFISILSGYFNLIFFVLGLKEIKKKFIFRKRMHNYHRLNSFEQTFKLHGSMLKTMQKVLIENERKILKSIIFEENSLVLSFSDQDHYHINFLGEIAYTSEKIALDKI